MANVPGTFYTAETQRRGTTPVSPPSAVDDPIDPVNPSGPPVVPPVAERYASEAAMIADQLNQKSGYLYFDGTDTWWYNGGTTGTISDYETFGSGGGGGITGSGTTNEIAYFTGGTAIGSLAVATYPSLTELAYVKGVTSSIQTQINNLGSKWTLGSGFIYRNGPVVVGDTALPTNAAFAVKGTTGDGATNNKIFVVNNISGLEAFSVQDNRLVNFPFGILTFGASNTGVWNHIKGNSTNTLPTLRVSNSSDTVLLDVLSNGSVRAPFSFYAGGITEASIFNGFKGGTTTSIPAVRIVNSANTVVMDVNCNGFVIIPGRLVVGGTAVVSGAWNSIRSGGSTVADSCLSIVNLANTLLFDLRSSGQLRLPIVKAQTTDPMVANAIWNDGGTLKFSAA